MCQSRQKRSSRRQSLEILRGIGGRLALQFVAVTANATWVLTIKKLGRSCGELHDDVHRALWVSTAVVDDSDIFLVAVPRRGTQVFC